MYLQILGKYFQTLLKILFRMFLKLKMIYFPPICISLVIFNFFVLINKVYDLYLWIIVVRLRLHVSQLGLDAYHLAQIALRRQIVILSNQNEESFFWRIFSIWFDGFSFRKNWQKCNYYFKHSKIIVQNHPWYKI